jgi:endoglucanase
VQFAGVNIAGFDFGCSIQGVCELNQTLDVIGKSNGQQQMNHFVQQSGLNAFRLPVGWQFLVNTVGGPLNATSFATYDKLVQGCLKSGAAVCIVDVHNYARFDGKIIGQGGPANEVLVNLWTQLATKYAQESKIAFGVMNEPHDIPNIETWAETVQAVVTGIRNAGATKQMILMPGNNFTSAGAFIENGSGGTFVAVLA